MFIGFFIIFIVTPLLELYILIEVGSAIGALPTILLTIFTAALGAFFMKHQGVQVVKQAQLSITQGIAPQQQVVEGVLVFMGGLMLLLPGLVTDLIGFLLLVPPIRAHIAKRWLFKRSRMTGQGHAYVQAEWTVRDTENGRIVHYETTSTKNSTNANQNPSDKGSIIEGEVLEDKPSSDKR
jgi:UPF0716 protein FxsA